jgi:hypothetical protein
VGLVGLVNGEVVGLDCLSSPAAYRAVSERLTRSYAIEALSSPSAEATADTPESWAEAFLAEIADAQEKSYPGVGLGTEFRYESGEAALAAIDRLRRKEETADKPSPETEAQRDMVRAW